MSLLLRPFLIGFLVNQTLSAVLLHMALLATIMAFDGLMILGDSLTIDMSFLLGPFSLSF
jgi:hypothetical protein